MEQTIVLAEKSSIVCHKRITARLNPQERIIVEKVLNDNLWRFLDSPIFHKPNAKKLIDMLEFPGDVAEREMNWNRWLANVGNQSQEPTSQNVFPVLSSQDERGLFLKYNYARKQVVHFRNEMIKGQKLRSARQLLFWYNETFKFEHAICVFNLGLVMAMYRNIKGRTNIEPAEMIQEGFEAIRRASKGFDVERGFKFSTYACRCILKSFSRLGAKDTKRNKLFPCSHEEKAAKGQTGKDIGDSDDIFHMMHIFNLNLGDLDEMETKVVRLRFGFDDPEGNSLTLKDVGAQFGLTKERIRQIQNRALEKLKERFIDS